MSNQLPPTARARTLLRVLGGVLLLAGLVIGGIGVHGFLDQANSETMDGGFGPILTIAGGGFLIVIGLAMLNAGFLGAQSRYVAGETMPTVKQSAAYLTDGEGILGVGRTSGPFCRACGTRNDESAKFCDNCGAALA